MFIILLSTFIVVIPITNSLVLSIDPLIFDLLIGSLIHLQMLGTFCCDLLTTVFCIIFSLDKFWSIGIEHLDLMLFYIMRCGLSHILEYLSILIFFTLLVVTQILEGGSAPLLLFMHFWHQLLLSVHILNMLHGSLLLLSQLHNTGFQLRLLIFDTLSIYNCLHHFCICSWTYRT